LLADELIDDLLSDARLVNTGTVIAAAEARRSLGKPPGKKNSLGDAVNWESLLGSVPDGAHLCLVSSDSDYASPLDANDLDEYLAEEWRNRKGSTVQLFRNFFSFLEAEYPDIHLVTDVWKHLLIESLSRCTTFDETHQTVQRLARHDLTALEAERLLQLALENNQVRWIALDADVRGLIEPLIGAHGTTLPPVLVGKWRRILTGQVGPYGSLLELEEEPDA
jgi:hypothetical protein